MKLFDVLVSGAFRFCVLDFSNTCAGCLVEQESDLDDLEKTVEPSWPKMVEPVEKIVDRLTVVWGMVNHLKSVKDTPELRAAIEEVQVL